MQNIGWKIISHCAAIFFLIPAAVLISCSDDVGDGNGDTDGDVDTDSDGDTDGDTDSDTDADTDTDSDLDAGDTDHTGDFNTDNICEKIELKADAIPNRVMILQDLSSSLKTDERWNYLKEAMAQVLEQYQSEMALGIVPFSTTILDGGSDDADCTVNRDQILLPEVENGAAIEEGVYSIDIDDLVGGTPMYDALAAGRDTLIDNDPRDGSKAYMILVTDGMPNCLDGNGGDGPTEDDIDQVTLAVDAIHTDDDIDIFTVGYAMGESELATLNSWAELGGTEHCYPTEDTQSFLDQMSAISGGLISCSYELDSEVDDPKYVRVEVDGVTLKYDDPDGWSLGDDNKTVTVEGASCDTLQDGETHSVDVAVECSMVIV